MSADRIVVRPDPDLADLIPGFLDNRRGDLEKIRALLGAGDAPALRRLGHDLKGCGSAYGFDPISEYGAQIEKAAIAGDLAAVTALGAQLAEYLSRVDVRFD